MRRQFIKERKGNLLDLFDKEDSELHVIAHGANCFNTMGAGIAKDIKARYPEVFYADMYYPVLPGDMERLGNISGAHNNEIYNIYTQFKPGANADYCALRIGLRKLNALFMKDKDVKTLGLPLIGCGIGGLKWKQVKEIILEEITDMNLIIVHFTDEYLEKVPETCEEFNTKWRFHLESGFEAQGMMIDDKEVIKAIDKSFRILEDRYPTFTYSQIKLKYGSARVYVDNVGNSTWANTMQLLINRKLSEKE